jgi:F0F1-type ATP synthase membrane subunit b/b'
MLAFVNTFLLFFAEAAHGKEGGIMGWWHTTGSYYLSYPGFEAWKFFNLAIFIFIMYKLLNKPLSAAFKAKREVIRAELIKAEEEKQAALSALTSAEAKLAGLETEKSTILKRAADDAEAEKIRIAGQTEADVARARTQSQGEISRLTQQAKAELRKFSAEESIRLAEEKLRAQINPENDARLVKAGIQSIGGLN